MMNLTELSKNITFANQQKGFTDKREKFDRYLLLTISEICEAQEELRDGRKPDELYYQPIEVEISGKDIAISDITYTKKPCGFPVELADAIIRLLDLFGAHDQEVRIICGTINFSGQDGEIESALLRVARLIAQAQYTSKDDRWSLLSSALSGLFAIARTLKIDIFNVIDLKLGFNASRPPKHGRQF